MYILYKIKKNGLLQTLFLKRKKIIIKIIIHTLSSNLVLKNNIIENLFNYFFSICVGVL